MVALLDLLLTPELFLSKKFLDQARPYKAYYYVTVILHAIIYDLLEPAMQKLEIHILALGARIY